ncbi:hypothetical protein KKF69_07480 [Patescibacteria group bacterium]|nr:hypothetical protein [Patescibacteria group bacterium]
MKISIILTTVALLFAININTASALTQIQTGNKSGLPIRGASESGKEASKEMKEKVANTTTERLQQKAGNEITRRITSLTNINNRISKIKRLTENQKSSLTNDIQSEITNLTELNKNIQPETDLETLRTYVKSIITSHRTYLLFLPKTQIIITANAMLNAADKLNELATKLQSRISEAESRGEDTSNLETTLADMQTKIADAKTQANNAINAVSILKPADYPDNKPDLQNARTMLQTAHKDLITAKQDAQKIITELRKLNNITITPEANPESTTAPTNIPDTATNMQTISD